MIISLWAGFDLGKPLKPGSFWIFMGKTHIEKHAEKPIKKTIF